MSVKDYLAKKYNLTQGVLLRESRTVLGFFKTDQAKFGSFDKAFLTPFDTVWLASIVAGENEPDDDSVVVDQKLETEEVESEMEACRACFQGIKYFIEKAFPNQPTIWQKFGTTHYDLARKNHDKMFRLMTNLSAAAIYYKDELIAAGYTQIKIDAIQVLRDALNEALTNQQTLIDGRAEATAHRITILNEVWDYRTAVAKAAKEIFEEKTAKYIQYLLPGEDQVTPVFNFSGTTTEVGTGIALEDVMINISSHLPIMSSDAKGNFGQADVPTDSYNALATKDGYLEKNFSVNKQEGIDFVIHIEMEKYHAKSL